MKWDLKFKTNLLLGLFVAAIIAANMIGTKVAHVFFDFSVGIFAFPLTFLITDIIEEVHGKKKTKEFVYIAFVCLVFVLAITAFAVKVPFAERSFVQENYTQVFGTTMRIFIASIIAFFIGQMHDVWAFNFWKQKTKGKYLWLRNNLSTIVSQLIDTVIFMFIAFYGVSPKFTISYLFVLIIPYWLIKVGAALLDSPFVYLGVKWLRGYVYKK